MLMSPIRAIEISFAASVDLHRDDERILHSVIGNVCQDYEASHPGRIMWVFGMGAKMLCHPMQVSDDQPIPFDDSILSLECAERADYSWLCAKCGLKQDEHKTCMLDGEAGECDFEPAPKDRAVIDRGVVPNSVYFSAVNGRRNFREALKAEREKSAELLSALQGLMLHCGIADAASEDKDAEDHALERAARDAISKATATGDA